MVVADKPRHLIVSTAGNFFNASVQHDEEDIEDREILDRFLEQSSCRTLCARPVDTDRNQVRLKLSTELPAGIRNTLVFFKVTAATVTEENFHDVVQVASTGCGDGSVLIEVLRQVWAPTLRSSGLSTSCLKKLEERLLSSGFSTSVAEEEEFWKRKRDEVKRSHERTNCEEAAKSVKNIKVELESAAVSRDGLIAVEEACEAISVFVDDLWKLSGPAYTEERMKSFLDVIGNEVVQLIQNYLDTVDTTDTRAKDETIALGATVCEKWMNATQKLTELFWPHYSLHPWRGPIFVPEKCSKLGRNLRQMSELRAQHRQLSKLLTPNERSGLGIEKLLQTFDDTRVALGNDEWDNEWNRLKRKIEDGLIPAEERVAQKLKDHIADADTPSALVAEFERYGELMKREGLKRALRGERESLLAAYRDLIENRLAGPDTEYLLDAPKVLQEVQAARSAEVRLESLAKLGKELLVDLPGYEEVAARLSSALKEAEDKRRDLVESWINTTKNDIAKKDLSLGTDSAVVELTGTSMMRVTYDPRLMTLIREARALSGEGVELPREIRELVDRASSLAGRARALQQVATFHNTIGDRMVPSQRPLMLTIALELARAVQEQSGVVWSDPHLVDVYTARLKELVVKFARQNSELISKHSTLRDYVSGLLKGDAVHLVGNQNIWKETLINMRAIVDAVDSEYGNARAWKLHWDRQLLKALGVAYRNALPSLSKKLSEIRVELTFRDGSLQWRPPLEDIRAKLYSGIRRSLSIPVNFRGVGDIADARFGDLVQKNAYLFSGVYKQVEIVLSTLELFRTKWLNLATPANIDVGERLKGKPPQEWAKAFKEAKQWAQEVGKLRGCEIKISCICIDTATTRNDLEIASRHYWERLSYDLRAEASSRLVAIVDFLSFASKELERRPRDVEEVGLAHEAHARIEQQSAGIAEEMEVVAVLAKVMAAWTSEKLDGVNAAHAALQDLGDRLEKHKSVMTRLLEDAKVNLRHRAIALRDERERWQVKWSTRSENLTLDWLVSMKERWLNLNGQLDSLKADCKRISLDLESVLEDNDINLSQVERELETEESNYRFQSEFLEELKNQETEEWAVARRRLPRLHDWLDSWENKIRLHDNMEIDTFVGKKIKEVRSAIESIQPLRGDEIADEHWTELIPILGLKVENPRSITLGHLFACIEALKKNEDRIKEITKRAIAESGIRQALIDLEVWESTASLPLQESTDSKNMMILLVGDYGSLLAKIEELRLLLEGAKGTSGHDRFASRAARCEAALSELEERIKALSSVQRKWIYLDPVYGSGAAPNDSGKWSRADKEFRYLIGEVSRDPRVPSLRQLSLPALISLKDLLDRCQKCLDEFLEEKRAAYPRLYFLSDEDLLELVSGSGRGLEAHLPKLYHGIGSVIKENNSLTAIVSPEGEVLKLPEVVDLTEPLPRWLDNLEKGIRNALCQSLEKCLNDSTPDPSVYPTQILLLSERIGFTERCERALKEGRAALQKLVEYMETQRARYRGLEDAGDKLTALKARGLLLDTVHHLQVARTLLKIVVTGENASWTWHKQLRSYKTKQDTYVVRCAGAELPYRFEYQGASIGLVRTPLTEKCFLALTQAMKLGLGGSPTGPAGTGKTESVKALASVLGRLVLVFNCDEGMDTGSMKRILGGLAQAGAWGCFDEFNRLEEDTLSAVSMLVRPLQEALRNGSPEILLGDQKIKLDPHCCIFITMNPAGSEYGGRRKLPDSLARLFRPISMAHPDKSDIARTLLECAGFLEATTLGKRLVEALEIAGTILSEQPHYDWGLRALKSVLNDLRPIADVDETTRLLVSIRASTLPKLTEADTTKFLSLLDDLFLKANLPLSVSTESEDLVVALLKICETRGLTKEIVNRCIQLNDLLKSRTGVAIVGPPGSGKSSIRSCLTEALTKIGVSIQQIIVYPGAIPKSRLLGHINPRTREWKEGVLSSAVTSAGNSATWIVFNGDVEPEWAEALNSALDDNRLLTLPNGIGIKLGSGTRFIFETHKLADASPATVSRLGVLHLGSTRPTSLLVPWRLEQLSSTAAEIANTHLCSCIDETLKINVNSSSASGLMAATLCHLHKAQTFAQATQALLVSLCGQVENSQSKDDLAKFIYGSTESWCPDPQKPSAVLYDSETDRLVPFSDTCESIDTDYGPISISDRIKKALAATLPWIEDGHPIMIRGSEACGKNALIDVALARMKNQDIMTVVRGSSLYGPDDLVNRLKKACLRLESSSQGRTYKPRSGSRVLLILEDMHLAAKNLQELMRELLQEEGFLEEDLEFSKISVTIICTADMTTRLHPRLEALFATYYLEYPSQKDVAAILELHLRTSLKEVDFVMAESWIARIKSSILDAFRSISSAQESSFTWTLKDIVLWAKLLKHYPTPENEAYITHYLLDIGQRLFRARLTPKALTRWESLLISKDSEVKDFNNDVYAWKSANIGLYPLSEEQWREEIINAAARCAREGQPVQASISSYLLEIIAGLSWAIGCDFRGMVLIGRPGSGRRSAVKLVATYSSLRLIDSGPERGKVAIKNAVQAAGIENQSTLLLLEEHHVREESLAVMVSAMVSKGEVPGLYAAEELDALVAPLADLARREDFQGTLEQYLYHRLRKYLRVAVILDSEEIELSSLLRLGLLRHCALLGSGPGGPDEWWSRESSLIKLAIQEGTLQLDELEELSNCAKVIIGAHLQAPRYQRVPARFLALVHTWRYLRDTWSKEVEEKLRSLEAGISKLKEAGDQVAKLEDEVSRQRQELEVEKGRANAALEQITATMRGATTQRGEMTSLKANTERESAELARRKADIEGELGKVEPLVAQAAQAVAGISADALAEVRSLRAPPAPVRDVLEGVLRLMGIKDTSWNSMKTFLAKRGIKDEIRNWDARRSTPASLEAVSKLIKERPDSFEEKTAKRASVAAAPLAAWVLANLQYGQILEQVAPLEREQRQLADRLAAAEAQLGKLETGLNTVESRVAQLQKELAEHTRGAAELQLRTESAEASLSTARALLRKLDTEHRDWQTQFQELTARKERLDVEAANAAALLVYQDPERDDNWKKSATKLLVTERERLLWRAQGLPADTSSLVAASRVLKGPLVSIFLDPSGVAVTWIKRNFGTRLEITQPENSKFLTALELAVRFGKPLLVEEVVEFPSILLPLLRRGPLRLGDRILPAQEGFQLFLATRKDRLEDIPKEADAVLCEITLGAGTKSLAERFVEKLLLNETPELEAQRREALEREERLSGERDAARLDVLSQLATARGQDLLQESQEQGGLLSSLEATQAKAKEIAIALEESRQSLNEVSRRAENHEKFAQFAANVYETIKGLTLLSSLYVISAEAYTDICLKAVQDDISYKNEDGEKKESRGLIEKRLITLTYHHCAKAIYRKHRLPLALHMALSLNPVLDVERNLLFNSGAMTNADNSDFELPEWIPDERREAVQTLGSSLPNVAARMKPSWLNNVSDIYADNGLSAFQKVLVVKALRPDYLHTALSKLAAKQLGVKDLAPPLWSLSTIVQEKAGSYPVLLLLSPGTDPGPELKVLAEKYTSAGFTEVSLGQGHVTQAELALETACRNGGWVLLSNLQLALNWLPRLESMLRSSMCTTNKNSSTRIWLTTEECSGFYPGLAGLCLKLAYEPPEGVKRNMRKSLQQLRQSQRNGDDVAATTLVLAWLHATLQERRNFVPQGWIRSYEWNESDLEAAYELVVKNAVKEKRSQQENILACKGDWQIGRGLLDVAVYGGRLQDDYDARALRSMIRNTWSRDIFEGRRKLGDVLKVTDTTIGDPVKSLESMDDVDSPKEYFGLPANAHRAWERAAAEKALTYLKGILMKPFNNSEENSNKLEKSRVQHDLKVVMERQCSLTFTCDTGAISERKGNPLQDFFIDEIDLTKKLLHIVQTDMDASSFEDNETPKHWLAEWRTGPKNAIQFAKLLLSNYEALRSSAINIPSRVDLSQLSRPRALLTALKQHTARELGHPLETLHLCANWTENRVNKEWKVSLQLEGLLISGASIEQGVLKDLDVNSAAVAVAPTCQVAFMPEEYSDDKSGDGNVYALEDTYQQDYLNIPVYTSVQREALICSLPITCPREECDAWLRRGVILYLR
ncbi:PREDICTED: cytoplasmic dynein 2 heavy chain 1 [Cyphomyrmex costatus]|uniref:cytoplasmic dynein 2 heavy chain 1 n=1 Tax=Cyphomyrmex costatus TaxID=456900 RepID=UPI000852313A|nr:PREDICTED: cytoplasmic dynein 2 heavy chain 1 [Cyphomyrmex costatus]